MARSLLKPEASISKLHKEKEHSASISITNKSINLSPCNNNINKSAKNPWKVKLPLEGHLKGLHPKVIITKNMAADMLISIN